MANMSGFYFRDGRISVGSVSPSFVLSREFLDESSFRRGAAFSGVTAGFLLNESLRLFNHGARGAHLVGTPVFSKKAQAIKPNQVRNAILQFGNISSHLIYHHVNNLTFCSAQLFAKHFNMSDDYVSRLANAHYSRHWLAPHLFAETPQLLSPPSRKQVFSLSKLDQLNRGVEEMLRPSSFVDYARSAYDVDLEQLGPRSSDVEWVGGNCAIAPYSLLNPESLLPTTFSGSKQQPPAIGLAEKIVNSCLALQLSGSGPGTLMRQPEDDFPAARIVREHMGSLLEALSRLERSDFTSYSIRARKGKIIPSTQLAMWLADVMLQRDFFHYYWFVSDSVPEEALDPTPAIREQTKRTLQSDFLWGVILSDYLLLFLIRMAIRTLISSVPFYQLFKGGVLGTRSGKRFGKVGGVCGPTGLALWELFSTVRVPSAFYASALQGQTTFARMIRSEQTGAFEVTDETIKPPRRLARRRPHVHFPDWFPKPTATGVSRETVYIFNETTTLPVEGQSEYGFTARQLLTGYSTGLVSQSLRMKMDWLEKNLSDDLKSTLAAIKQEPSFSGRPPFADDLLSNPPILDSFFRITSFKKGPIPRVAGLGKRGEIRRDFADRYARSDIVYGAKLFAHLQSFVASRLFSLAHESTGFAADYPQVTDHITYTCASIQWGGKFPPHITHRDGWGVDWGLRGRLDSPAVWHHSTNWPLDSESLKFKNKEGRNVDTTLSIHWMKRTEAVSSRTKRLKGIFWQLLKKPRGKRSERAALAKQHAKNERLIQTILADVQDELEAKGLIDLVRTEGKGLGVSGIPVDCCIAQQQTTTDRVNPSTSIKRRFLFREPIRRALRAEFNQLRTLFRDARPPKAASEEGEEPAQPDPPAFDLLASKLRGFPVFEDQESHVAHHLAHLAVMLAMPLRVIWGAPIYHVRGAQAIYRAFAEEQPSMFGGADGDISLPRLTLPEFAFMPHNHHHHWHLTFSVPSALRRFKRARFISNNIESQNSYETACIELWRWLGLELGDFEAYLSDYARHVRSVGKSGRPLLAEIRQLEQKIREVYLVPSTDDYRAAGRARRERVFKEVYELARTKPHDRTGDMTQWPPTGTLLERGFEFTEVMLKLLGEYEQFFDETGEVKIELAETLLSDEFLDAVERKDDDVLSALIAEEDETAREEYELQETDDSLPVTEDPLPGPARGDETDEGAPSQALTP